MKEYLVRIFKSLISSEKIIDLVKYSRAQRSLKRTGTDGAIIEQVSLRQIKSEHYNQAKSYIERIQTTIPGQASKIIKIRERLRLI